MPLHPGILYELAGEMPLGTLERRSGRGHVERLLFVAATREVVHALLDCRRVVLVQLQHDAQHDVALIAHHGMAVTPIGIGSRDVDDAPGIVEAGDASRHIAQLSAICARVHDGRAADGAGDASRKLVTGETRRLSRTGHFRVHGARLGDDSAVSADGHVGHLRADAHDDAAQPLVGHKHVAAASKDIGTLPRVATCGYDRRKLFGAAGRDEAIGRPTHAERRMPAHGLVARHIPVADNAAKLFYQLLIHAAILSSGFSGTGEKNPNEPKRDTPPFGSSVGFRGQERKAHCAVWHTVKDVFQHNGLFSPAPENPLTVRLIKDV